MRPFFCAMLLGCWLTVPSVLYAESSWKTGAVLDDVKLAYPRVLEAQWADSGALWLFANKADISWSTVTSQLICPALEIAGKPDGEIVIVTYLTVEGSGDGTSETMARESCN